MPLHVSSKCAHHQEVKIALHSLWYHHTVSCTGWERMLVLSQPVHETATYRCDDTRGCVMQFWAPDDEHICSKPIEAWNKFIVEQKFSASSWLITEINTQFVRFEVKVLPPLDYLLYFSHLLFQGHYKTCNCWSPVIVRLVGYMNLKM